MGILLKNESKYSDMLDIMDTLHQLVPKKNGSRKLKLGDREFDIEDEVIHQILFGGDQMTAARARGSLLIRGNATSDSTNLLGLLPVAEDWHAKVVFYRYDIHISTLIDILLPLLSIVY